MDVDGGFLAHRATSKRLGDFWLSSEAFGELLRRRRGYWLKIELSAMLGGPPADLPEDAYLVGVACSWERQSFLARFEHPSFAEVPDGWTVPVLGELHVFVRPESPGCQLDHVVEG